MSGEDATNRTYDFGSAVVGVAALFYATSATMFLAATQTWAVHLARQSFLTASKTAIYFAIGLTFLEAILILARLLAASDRAAFVLNALVFVAAGVIGIWGMGSLYGDLLPVEICTTGEAAACLPAPSTP